MSRIRVISLLGAAVLFVPLAFSASAQQAPASEPFFRVLKIDTRYLTRELIEETFDETITVNAPSLVQPMGQITFPVNENFFDVVSLEAETIKADGKRVPVQPDKVLIASQPNAPTLTLFQADVKSRTIIFPDVQPGDSVHYKVTIRQKKPFLAGGYSQVRAAVPAARHKSFVWTIDDPDRTLKSFDVHGFAMSSLEEGGRKLTRYTLAPQSFRAEEPGSTAIRDRVPRVYVSSYSNKAEIAKAFYDGAVAKAEPTPEVTALANQITQGITDRKAQARAIFDYVSTQIRYMAIYLGNGGWVPHDANDILKNKFGDCKDHVTLMRALLTAKGIESEYALINVAPTYRIVATPVYAYDHVILYLPEFDLYTDPTAGYSTFESAPLSAAGKEVLRIGTRGVVETRAPGHDAARNVYSLKTEVTLRDDGSPIGKTVAEATGPLAQSLRSLAANATQQGTGEFVKTRLNARRWRGTGELIVPSPLDHSDPYRVVSAFDLQNRYFGGGRIPPQVLPAGIFLLLAFPEQINAYIRNNRTQDFPCVAQTNRHSFAITLPANKPLAEVPKNVEARTGLAQYAARYRFDGTVLHVEREFVATVPSVCTAEMVRTMQPVVTAYRRDIRNRLKFTGETVNPNAADNDDADDRQ